MRNTDDLVSQVEAAQILGVDDSTVSRWSDHRLKPEARRLTVVMRRPGPTGVKLFRRSDVETLAAELAETRTA